MNAVHHSDCLPADLALDLPVLPGQLIKIIKNPDGGLEADAMLS